MPLREVTLPPDVPGHLYLSRMPGSTDHYAEDRAAYEHDKTQVVICLAPMEEVTRESPDYEADLASGNLPWDTWMFPMGDFGVSPDRMGFLALARRAADALRRGEHIVVHCLAGVGRSGTLAICILMALGEPFVRARAEVEAARGRAEADEQRELIRWVEQHLSAHS